MRLECDCGYVADAAADQELVEMVRAHAWQAHRVDLTAPVIRSLADTAEEGRAPTKPAL